MEFFIFCTIGNIILNVLLAIFHKKSCANFKDLGKIKVPIKITGPMGKGKKKYYLMCFSIEDKETGITISEEDFELLENYDSAEIYVRKFPSKLNSYIEQYSCSLHKVDWAKKDKIAMWKGLCFGFLSLEIFIVCIAFQLEMPI